MGREPMAEQVTGLGQGGVAGDGGLHGQGNAADVGAGLAGSGQHGPPTPIFDSCRLRDGGDAVDVGGGGQVAGEKAGHALGTVVSAAIIGTQSNPISPVVEPEKLANA